MKLGISLPYRNPDDSHISMRQLMARARLIEDTGFDGIWFGDTISRTANARPDTLMWLEAAAAATERIELGTAVIQVPLRNPVELAVRLMTLHALSGGRFWAGLGAGSTKKDFDAVGVDYEQRFKLFAKALPIMRRLCNGEQVGDANLQPWPSAGKGPPILIGSWESGIWVKRAARNYDGWMASGRTTLNKIKIGIERFRAAGGKRALVSTIPVDLSQPEARLDPDEIFSLNCGPQSAKERLQMLADLGYDDALLVRLDHTEADITADDLRAIRALLPREGA